VQSFGKYQLLKKLATGGMAEVWLARQTGIEGFNRTVVLKRILPHLAEDPEFVQMFLNEARIAAKFNHPNIAQIYDLGETGGTYYIAMEYIHGEDLGRVMRKAWSTGQWIAQPLAIRIVAACCEGLYYAHAKTDEQGRPLRVVHRDISPQNILISFDGSVKLVDFGIAKAADLPSLTKSGAIKGKFAYMAPEQAAGKVLDHRSDIFAIGLVLYELLTGVRPLKRDSEIGTLQAALECAIEPPSVVAEVPNDLDSVVMRSLAKAADDRYRDARLFQMALEEFLVGQRMVASSVQISELMHTLFADRLAEEAASGQLEVEQEELSGRSQPAPPEEISRTSASRNAAPLAAWEAPPASGQQNRVSKGFAKGNYAKPAADAPERPAPPPPADVAAWEAPPGVDGPRRSRTGVGELPVAKRTEGGTAIARTPSRPDMARAGNTRSVVRTRTAARESLEDLEDGHDDRQEPENDPLEDSRDAIPAPAPRRSTASSTSIPRTASKAQVRRMTGSNLARAVDPAEDRDEVSPARALEEAPPRKKRLTGEVRAQAPARSGEKPRQSGEKPRRTLSREMARANAPVTADEVDGYLDVEGYKEQSRKRLKTVLMVSTAAALALMGFIFRDAIWATLTSAEANQSGRGIYISVESNIPVQVLVKHHKDEQAVNPIEPLRESPVVREVRIPGAHLRDTIILQNVERAIYFEHEAEFGQPGDVVELTREFRTGHVLLKLKPANVRDLSLYSPRSDRPLGQANLKIELVEGTHKLELRGDSLKKPQPVEVRIRGGETTTVEVPLTHLDPAFYK